MKYRGGYKYQLAANMKFNCNIKVYRLITTESGRVQLTTKGVLTVYEGYAWDGATGAPDTKAAIIASCGHDALYQLMREGRMPFHCWRQADQDYNDWLRLGGAWRLTCNLHVRILKMFKGRYARPKNRKKVYTI